MKKLIAAVMASLALWQARAAESTWLTSLSTAEAQAKAEHKIILMDFTGSDWCPWCIKFKKDVLDTPEFEQFAAQNVVLVEVDFPNKALPAALKDANAALKEKYNVHGFPTLLVVDQSGKELGRQVGYSEGGPQPFIKKLEQFEAKAKAQTASSARQSGS